MAYDPTIYVNDSTPAINAENLNKNETALKYAYDTVENSIHGEVGKNLFNGVTVEGYLKSDGSIQTDNRWKTTDFVKVSGLSAITMSAVNSSSNRVTMTVFYLCTYNSSKQLIEQVGRIDGTYTVGSGVKYIRFSYAVASYVSDIMIESGSSATAYEPYEVTYTFTKSPYIDEYSVDKFNRYEKTNNFLGQYITSTGSINTSSNTARCKVPCKKGDVLEICRPQQTSYASGGGLMLVCNSSDTVLASVNMDDYDTIYYGNLPAVKYPVTSNGAAYISFNVKMSNYDSTNDTVVTNRNINGEYTGDYVSEIEGKKLWAVNANGGNKWNGKTWVCVGDSLTDVNIRTTKHYFEYVAEETGILTVNMGNSGSGYAAEKDLGTAFFQRISSVPTDADVITIFGSFNDLASGTPMGEATDTGTSTIGGCINSCLDNLFETYPLATVGVVAPTPWENANPTTEPNHASEYVTLLETICKNRSIPFLDLFHNSLLRPWEEEFRELAYSKDEGSGVHPDETGHKIIAPRFKAFLETLLF